jgi:hypothetical protein
MVHTCNSSYGRGVGRRITGQGWPQAKNMRLYQKNNKSKKSAGAVAQMVQYLPNKHETLNSNPNTTSSPSKTKTKPKTPMKVKRGLFRKKGTNGKEEGVQKREMGEYDQSALNSCIKMS